MGNGRWPVQVAAVDSSGARFLLAAETAHVMGVDMPNRQRVTTLAVREVQVRPPPPLAPPPNGASRFSLFMGEVWDG